MIYQARPSIFSKGNDLTLEKSQWNEPWILIQLMYTLITSSNIHIDIHKIVKMGKYERMMVESCIGNIMCRWNSNPVLIKQGMRQG